MSFEKNCNVENENLKKIKDDTLERLKFIRDEIGELNSLKSRIQEYLPLILTLITLGTIIGFNREILVNNWLASIFLFIIFLTFVSSVAQIIPFTKQNVNNPFKDEKQFKIAFFLTLICIQKNQQKNDIAFWLIWIVGWILIVKQYLENTYSLGKLFIIIFTITLFTSTIVIFFNKLLYDLTVWSSINIASGQFYQNLLSRKYGEAIKDMSFKTILNVNKLQFVYVVLYFLFSISLLLSFILLYFAFFQNLSWEYLKYVVLVFILQLFIYFTLVSFFSARDAEQIYEDKKIKMQKILSFLDQSEENITEENLKIVRTHLRESQLILCRKINFFLFFTKWIFEANGELNINENYDFLYQYLMLPPEVSPNENVTQII